MTGLPDDVIYAATPWVTNAQMIADCHRLGYLKDTDLILDPTYGRGTWWRLWHPPGDYHVIGHQWRQPIPGGVVWSEWLRDDWPLLGTWDFRNMWYQDETFDAVAFDPPYVCVGGRTTTGIGEMHAAYGMGDTPTTPGGVQADIDAGLLECFRVVKKGGIVLVKVQSYVTSGKLWPGTFYTWRYADLIGFQLVDHLNHISGARPQPAGRRQVHARRNQSDLLILRRPLR